MSPFVWCGKRKGGADVERLRGVIPNKNPSQFLGDLEWNPPGFDPLGFAFLVIFSGLDPIGRVITMKKTPIWEIFFFWTPFQASNPRCIYSFTRKKKKRHKPPVKPMIFFCHLYRCEITPPYNWGVWGPTEARCMLSFGSIWWGLQVSLIAGGWGAGGQHSRKPNNIHRPQ